MGRSIIEKFAAGADVPGNAIRGLTQHELNSFPVPGTWSIQQLIVHLMESHLVCADRMRRIIAEENPTLIGYNETLFIKNLFPERLDATTVCEAFRLNQLLMAEILRQLPDAAFDRAGMHNERGRLTLGSMVKGYVEHLDHHMKFLRAKLKALGRE
jgi:hypothetical protein